MSVQGPTSASSFRRRGVNRTHFSPVDPNATDGPLVMNHRDREESADTGFISSDYQHRVAFEVALFLANIGMWIGRLVRIARAVAVLGPGFRPGFITSARAWCSPSMTTVWTTPLSKRNRSPKLASQMRVAFSSIAWKTGSSSPDDELTTLNTSDVAACRSNASSSSRVSRATSLSSRAADALRPLASMGLMRRFALVVF